jgi:hypothetical protein
VINRNAGDAYSVSRLAQTVELGGPEVATCKFCGKEVRNTRKARLRHVDTCDALVGHAFRVEAMKVSKLHAEFKRREAIARQQQREADEKMMQGLHRDLREYVKTRKPTARLLAWVRKGTWKG